MLYLDPDPDESICTLSLCSKFYLQILHRRRRSEEAETWNAKDFSVSEKTHTKYHRPPDTHMQFLCLVYMYTVKVEWAKFSVAERTICEIAISVWIEKWVFSVKPKYVGFRINRFHLHFVVVTAAACCLRCIRWKHLNDIPLLCALLHLRRSVKYI